MNSRVLSGQKNASSTTCNLKCLLIIFLRARILRVMKICFKRCYPIIKYLRKTSKTELHRITDRSRNSKSNQKPNDRIMHSLSLVLLALSVLHVSNAREILNPLTDMLNTTSRPPACSGACICKQDGEVSTIVSSTTPTTFIIKELHMLCTSSSTCNLPYIDCYCRKCQIDFLGCSSVSIRNCLNTPMVVRTCSARCGGGPSIAPCCAWKFVKIVLGQHQSLLTTYTKLLQPYLFQDLWISSGYKSRSKWIVHYVSGMLAISKPVKLLSRLFYLLCPTERNCIRLRTQSQSAGPEASRK